MNSHVIRQGVAGSRPRIAASQWHEGTGPLRGAVLALLLLAGMGVTVRAGMVLPLELRQTATPYNLQSATGVPISGTVGVPSGSDGRMTTGLNESGSYNVPTTHQFRGLITFGSGPSPTNWLTRSNSVVLRGTNAFSSEVIQHMQLPRGLSNGVAVFVTRRAQVGAPYLSRQVSFAFGSLITPPATDENGVLLTNIASTAYWLPEPYSTNSHLNSGYYWSQHGRQVYAIQPGPLNITWRKATPYLAGTTPAGYNNTLGSASYETNGTSIYLLYTAGYVASGSPSKPPRTMYWTEREFRALSHLVGIPSARVGAVNVIYNNNFPRNVASEYRGPGYTSPAEGSTNAILQELRTLWYDQSQGYLFAYNQEGRVFVELLGDLRTDGQTREPLGYEIVDVVKQPTPSDLTNELGERLLPPEGGSVEDLMPEEIVQPSGQRFTYQYFRPGSTRPELYAQQATRNVNDCLVHWLETGLQGVLWPRLMGRHRLVWPDDVAKYSHFVRPEVATEGEAKGTAVQLNATDVPMIVYQDPLDQPRAKLTPEFKFYTFLTTSQPAHRTLLRYIVNEQLAYERVFSWLDSSLRSTNLAGSVAAELAAYNTGDDSVTWPDMLTAPAVVNATVAVGDRIKAPAGELGSAGDYVAGHINQSQGVLFNPNAYVDPLVAGFDAANDGAIIPVNAVPGTNVLEVWWFRVNNSRAGLNAGNRLLGFSSVYWPSVIGRYTIQWPQSPREIVLASKIGSGALTSMEALGALYRQNDPGQPGYNPNEEHAILSGGSVFATRDDLNITEGGGYSSAPYVLLDYTASDGRPAMSVFKVLREKPESGWVFDYVVPAGQLLQPPMPLPLLGKPVVGVGASSTNYNTEPTDASGDLPGGWSASASTNRLFGHYNRFTWRDRKDNFWVYRGPHAGLPPLAAGAYSAVSKSFGALPDAVAVTNHYFKYTLHASRQDEYLRMTCPAGLPLWLSISGLSLLGTPPATAIGTSSLSLVVEDVYDHVRVTNTLSLQVVGSGSVAGQSPLTLSSTNAYTGVTTVFSNRPPFLAASPTSTNSFTMRYYYKTEASFDWPGATNVPPVGSIVPYLRPIDAATGDYVGDGGSAGTASLDIVYRPVWPERDPANAANPVPTLPFGATVTTPKFNVAGVRDMTTARVLYQQSLASNLTNSDPSVVLHDATREKVSRLGDADLSELPGAVVADLYLGKYYFPNLPPHLSTRLYYDPSRASLVFKGEYVAEALGESYLQLNVLRGTDLAAAFALCPSTHSLYTNWCTLVGNLSTPVETFYEDPDVPGTYIPNTNLVVHVGIEEMAEIESDNTAVDSYALSATGPGAGYVTLIEADGAAFAEAGDPVAMHVLRVGDSLYAGEVKVIPASNPLSEQVIFQHTGDFAGRSDEFEYEWKIGAPADGLPPLADADMSRYLALESGSDLPRQLIGGAGVRALSDNYVVMRYRPTSTNHPLYLQWSDWTAPKLGEGWIKRVLAGINPFNQRLTDLFNNQVDTSVSMLSQAGKRWEGDVALNLEAMNRYGLIEIYETVLRRGRMLSIESGYNYGPANDALLLAAGYLNDLYMMIGGEAWADASNPTIGMGTGNKTYGDVATSLFAFKGQVGSLLEEELGLLRGRDDFLMPGVQVAPVYNRLVWNYTRGINSGEVVYALNYDIQEDPNSSPDGVINAADAAVLFPQGHGDAYGHYLTALKGYYSLLMNSCFDWVPRIEAVNVLGQPVSVDYLDERKFASGAAAVARAGQQVLDLTWRQVYQRVRDVGWDHLGASRSNTQRTYTTADGTRQVTRYWGVDHWASRGGQGAYIHWIVGNSMLPEEDPNPLHEGIQKIDRSTVPELTELAVLGASIQTSLESAESGLSPLGVPEDGVAFDINPNAVGSAENGTHFEQIYQRAKVALNNAVASFDDAKDVTRLMRSEQDSVTDYRSVVAQQEQAFKSRLIELYGSPYSDDIGAGKTYPQGYSGPDLLHYSYVDQVENSFGDQASVDPEGDFRIDLQTIPADFVNKVAEWEDGTYKTMDWFTTNKYLVFHWGPHGFFTKPGSWTGNRESPGEIQQAISALIRSHNAVAAALGDADGAFLELVDAIRMFRSSQDTLARIDAINVSMNTADEVLSWAQACQEVYEKIGEATKTDIEESMNLTKEALPQDTIAGLAAGGDLTSAARSAIEAAGLVITETIEWADVIRFGIFKAWETATATSRRWGESHIAQLETDEETKQGLIELGGMVAGLAGHYDTINARLREYDDALRRYRAVLAEGNRMQEERFLFRQRAAAIIQGYRTRDAAFRLFRNEKLERYKTLFDLAARYSMLAANAYDYETGLLGTSAGAGFRKRFIGSRALGVVRNGEPQFAGSNSGDPGLSSALAEMKADWDVLRGRLGFNSPDAYGTTLSMRTEAFRILPTADGDTNWKDALHGARKANLLEDGDVRRYCMQIDDGSGLPVPGIILTFSTTVAKGFNLFGHELSAGDHAFSPSSFATKIFAVGVALEGYHGMDNPAANSGTVGGTGSVSPSDPGSWFLDPLALSATPYIYLIPVGVDSMRTPPLGDTSDVRSWSVSDVAIPMPFNVGASDFSSTSGWQSSDSLSEPLFAIRKHQAFRPVSTTAAFSANLYGDTGSLRRSQFTNNRLVGRSVWNSQWKLVIPGATLLNDPGAGLDRFIQTVTDIKLHLVTYSYSGN